MRDGRSGKETRREKGRREGGMQELGAGRVRAARVNSSYMVNTGTLINKLATQVNKAPR